MATPQPDEKIEVQDLLQWIDSQLQQSYDISAGGSAHPEKFFIPVKIVEDAFKKDGYPFGKATLRALWPDSVDVPVTAHGVAASCSRVFCILIRIGKARFIEPFTRHPELYDNRLPFYENAPPPYFPKDSSSPDFFQRFCAEQSKFCSPELYKKMAVEFESSLILPFLLLDQRGTGSTSRVYRALIHSKHDHLVSGNLHWPIFAQ